MEWLKGRLKEPSSYAGVGVGVIGLGIVIEEPLLIFVGIGAAVLALILKEKGIL